MIDTYQRFNNCLPLPLLLTSGLLVKLAYDVYMLFFK